MARVLEDDDWRQSLRTGVMAVARPYTWDRCAAETLHVYRSVCGVAEAEPVVYRPTSPRGMRYCGERGASAP